MVIPTLPVFVWLHPTSLLKFREEFTLQSVHCGNNIHPETKHMVLFHRLLLPSDTSRAGFTSQLMLDMMVRPRPQQSTATRLERVMKILKECVRML